MEPTNKNVRKLNWWFPENHYLNGIFMIKQPFWGSPIHENPTSSSASAVIHSLCRIPTQSWRTAQHPLGRSASKGSRKLAWYSNWQGTHGVGSWRWFMAKKTVKKPGGIGGYHWDMDELLDDHPVNQKYFVTGFALAINWTGIRDIHHGRVPWLQRPF